MAHDSFGNPIDPVAGFARGSIITSATEEGLRLRNGQRIAADRVQASGPTSVAVFTGNQRDYPVTAADLTTLCEEWVGPGLFAEELRAVALKHLGGRSDDQAAVFNRTSAAIVATILALSEGRPVVSVTPERGRSHASVVHGSQLATSDLISLEIGQRWMEAIAEHQPALVVVTTVTSSLERMEDGQISAVVASAKRAGAVVLLDEAYGARLRPALHGGALALSFNADLAVTNCDKAGLSGPRAGLLVGRADLIARVSARGASLGMEARAPIAAGALRSLQGYDPELLREEARSGQELAAALAEKFDAGVVGTSDLGPMIHEDNVLRLILQRAGVDDAGVVPAEATSALGMILLRDAGILTVNTHGQPGARVSVRLKPTTNAIARIGGIAAVACAFEAALDTLATIITDRAAMAALILGDRS